ncbi:DUF2806 domain-containing protein [bacterium AH-315-I18]|nr:DUF2806 domain-containing protein [bacterium AH-315-I18]
MSDDNSMSLVNLGKLAKPADTLIKKVSSAVSGYAGPWQIKRVAKAEAEVALIKAKNEIEITDLHRCAMHRFFDEEARRQDNIETITMKALPNLNESSDPSKMEDDWVTNFFDKSRIISNGEMQDIWAKVLAGEANAPGTYSKRTVNFLGDLDKKDAEIFQNLCSFGCISGGFIPLIFDHKASIYNDKGIDFNSLKHLDSIGFIQFDSLVGFDFTGLFESITVMYCGQPLVLKIKKEEGNKLPVGKVLLTQLGRELTTVCNAPSVEGFFEYVKDKWKRYLPDESLKN